MRRRRRIQNGISGPLDSLVDIVANSLGTLVLIATLSMLVSRGMKINLGSPRIVPAPPDLKRIDFECRGNRLLPIDFSSIVDEDNAIRDSAASLEERRRMIREFNERRASDGFHLFELEEWGVRNERLLTSTLVKPLGHPIGDTVADLKVGPCEFTRRLEQLDPGKHYLMFYVQPDSFEVFRVARQMSVERGFAMGWHPRESEMLKFSPGFGRETVDFIP